MFETFKEKYSNLEKNYDEKRYDDVVREGGKIIESLVAYIFINFPSTLKTFQQKQLFFNFEKKFYSEGKKRFSDFISRPTIGVSIGFYKQLCISFKNENHIWLKESIVPALSSANSIRNKFAHAGNSKPSDDDAADLLDAFEEIIEKLKLHDAMPNSFGIPLASYLIYNSIMHSFDKVAQKEDDWKKIIVDSKKIIPQLLKDLFYSKYYTISCEDKELIFSDDSVFSKSNNENPLSVYENMFRQLKINKFMDIPNSNIDSLIQKYLAERKEKYDRRGVKPYTKLLDVLANSLIKPGYEEYLKYSVMIKNKYLHGNEIDDKERIELKSFAESLNISSKSAYRIEQEVIRVINSELTLYQTFKSTEKEKEADTTASPVESMLVNMIKAGASEQIVINVAETQNFKGDIYHLLSKYKQKKNPLSEDKLKPEEKNDPIDKIKAPGKSAINSEKEEKSSNEKSSLSQEEILKAFGFFSKEKVNQEDQQDNSKVFYDKAMKLFETKDYDKAIIELTKAIEQNSSYSEAYEKRGECYYNLKTYSKAVLDFSEAIKLDKTNANAFNNRANSYYYQKNYDNAIDDYSRVIQILPDSSVAYINRGNTYYFQLKEYNKAVQDYEKALNLDPGNAQTLKNKKDALKKIEENYSSSADSVNCNSDQNEQDLSKIFTDLFGANLGGNTNGSKTDAVPEAKDPQTGSDLKINIALTLEEISKETIREIKLNKYVKCQICVGSGAKAGAKIETCSACDGAGKLKQISNSLFGQMVNLVKCEDCDGFGEIISDICPACLGEGRVKEDSIITLTIPAGISDGQYLKIKGSGDTGRRGEEAGDLICMLKIADHSLFQRDGNDIHYELIMNKSLAVSGGDIIVPTLYGKVKLKLNPGLESGKILRLKEKGLPILNETGKGDMYATVKIQPD